MKKEDIDWSVLKKSIMFFSICIVLSGTLIGLSYYYSVEMEKQYRKNNHLFRTISQRYLDVDQEEQLLLDFYPKFVHLYNDGVLGREKRLDWIESLRQSGEHTKLPSLSYSIESQEKYTPAFTVNYGSYQLYRSSMSLKLGLLHEGDLFKLLNYLDKNVHGTYTISECEFNRQAPQIVFEKNTTNIAVSCILHWLTINLPGGKGIEL